MKFSKLLVIGICLAQLACSSKKDLSEGTSPIPGQGEAEKEGKPNNFQLIGKLRPSFYWVSIEPNDGANRDKKLLDVNGKFISNVSGNYLKKLSMEGTGLLLDGRVVNYHLRVTLPDGSREIRWRVCDPKIAPYGYGIDEIPLVAFKSTAVDPKVVKIGSKLYIPDAIGAVLPDGTIHDGYFTAVDIGDLIQNKKIDIFTSFGDQSRVFESIGLSTGKMTDVYLVN